MKTKSLKQTPPAVVLCLVPVLALATAIATRAAEKTDASAEAYRAFAERYGITPAQPTYLHQYGLTPAQPTYFHQLVDPASGLPLTPRQWIDPNWPDPGIVLTNVAYDGLLLGEVARDLRERFKNHFDLLVPRQFVGPAAAAPALSVDPSTGLPLSPTPTSPVDVEQIPISLQLKNVTATEVFNAMNLMFEAENAPQRWELLYNGKRPTVVFRYLPELQLVTQPARPLELPKKERRIVFAGDLIGEEKYSAIALEQLAKTLLDVCSLTLDRPASQFSDLLKLHKGAQLFIITGTQEEIKVVTDALSALSQKLRLETKRKAQPASEESKAKSEATKTP